jgi:hypothetical protein
LSNPRYKGWWEYGRTESVWVNKPGYTRQDERAEPLAGIQIEPLRILDDATWFAAQERLEKVAQNAGRPPADGDRQSRPRVLNGLVVCPPHQQQTLQVHGPYGKYMSCKACREAAEPELYSFLPRRLALDLVCDRLVDLIMVDESLVAQTIEAFRRYLQTLTQPDPAQAEALAREIERLTRQINFILDAPGDTEEDQKENRDRLGKLRSERAGNQKTLTENEEAAKNPAKLPDPAEVLAHLQQMRTMLREAAHSDDPAELAALHDLIKDLTGGKKRIMIRAFAATVVGEQLPRTVKQTPLPLTDLRGMHAELGHQLARRAVPPHRCQRHLRLHTSLDPSPFCSHVTLPSLDQSYHDFDLKSWSSFLGPV